MDTDKPKHLSLCQHCIWVLQAKPETHVLMLTGYSLWGQRCERCGYASDLAMCKREG